MKHISSIKQLKSIPNSYPFMLIAILLGLLTVSSFSQERFEIDVGIGYSHPQLEAWGTQAEMTGPNYGEIITIQGKRLLNSDNFAMNYGFTLQINGKLSLIKSGLLKGIVNLAFNQLEGKYPLPDGIGFGVRMPVFSIGAGLEINPFGVQKFYPSLYGLFRFSELGGESFHIAGVDFFIVSPRFGYLYGVNLNYRIQKRFGIFLGTFFAYDNWLNKQTKDEVFDDPHVINFRDKANSVNGLIHDRRYAYLSLILGVNFYLK
jgi:hypothetical protein